MDVARLNMSHGSHADHAEVYRLVREASDASGHGVGILADLQGPKIRLERFADGPVPLKRGQRWTITTRDVLGDATICGTTYKGLPGDVAPGDPLLIDDGKVRLRVVEVVDGTDVVTEVLVGGKVSNNKGINLPGVAVSVPALSDKDEADLRFALRMGVDFIALSFVRNAKDAEDVRAIMRQEGVVVPVIAKIEKPQAIENLDEVVAAFDAFMVARGDLGVECPLEEVPFLQKKIIVAARSNAKPVIVATQMLESMVTNPAPTRAEASDVANAVLDGADAVMLSGETSVGEHPIHTVETMARIVTATEEHALVDETFSRFGRIEWDPHTRSGVIAKAAEEVAQRVGAKYVVAFTQSGDSARRLARLRRLHPGPRLHPGGPLALPGSPSRGASRPSRPAPSSTPTRWSARSTRSLLKIGRVQEGDLVVIVAGSPPGIPGSTNALRIHRMGDAINEVAPAYRRR
ncbi:pyruvate kinase [Nocardioides convexus]|uniref:pyruvate kinase n=1 Tax=Nocardioides convexus TaxID=2712224 RepID=UPI0024189849|nr:pyruvate kinase [Nocardioides convexus]